MTGKEIAKVAVFEGKQIRKILHEGEWWFSVVDIVQVLTGSSIPKRYWSDLKRKLVKEGYFELYEKIVQLKFAAADGKFYATDCADTETMFRIIQSIPSPKEEPLKRWLAKVGRERIDEIENPELSMERMKELYEKKGYRKTDERTWISPQLYSLPVHRIIAEPLWHLLSPAFDGFRISRMTVCRHKYRQLISYVVKQNRNTIGLQK